MRLPLKITLSSTCLFALAALVLSGVSLRKDSKMIALAGSCSAGTYDQAGGRCLAPIKSCPDGGLLDQSGSQCQNGTLPGLDVSPACLAGSYAASNNALSLDDGMGEVGLKLCVPEAFAGFTVSGSCQGGYLSLPVNGWLKTNTGGKAKLCAPSTYTSLGFADACGNNTYPVPDFLSDYTGYAFVILDSKGNPSALQSLCVPGDGFSPAAYPAACPPTWQDAGGNLCWQPSLASNSATNQNTTSSNTSNTSSASGSAYNPTDPSGSIAQNSNSGQPSSTDSQIQYSSQTQATGTAGNNSQSVPRQPPSGSSGAIATASGATENRNNSGNTPANCTHPSTATNPGDTGNPVPQPVSRTNQQNETSASNSSKANQTSLPLTGSTENFRNDSGLTPLAIALRVDLAFLAGSILLSGYLWSREYLRRKRPATRLPERHSAPGTRTNKH